ncbi:SNF2-related protein [Nonomuraea sp. NPDC002799]
MDRGRRVGSADRRARGPRRHRCRRHDAGARERRLPPHHLGGGRDARGAHRQAAPLSGTRGEPAARDHRDAQRRGAGRRDGLGKTLQTIGCVAGRAEKGPQLVVCPTSLVGNWAHEIARFAPGLRTTIWRGGPLPAVDRGTVVLSWSRNGVAGCRPRG